MPHCVESRSPSPTTESGMPTCAVTYGSVRTPEPIIVLSKLAKACHCILTCAGVRVVDAAAQVRCAVRFSRFASFLNSMISSSRRAASPNAAQAARRSRASPSAKAPSPSIIWRAATRASACARSPAQCWLRQPERAVARLPASKPPSRPQRLMCAAQLAEQLASSREQLGANGRRRRRGSIGRAHTRPCVL